MIAIATSYELWKTFYLEKHSVLLFTIVDFCPHFLCMYSGWVFARQRESILVGDTVLFLQEEMRGCALSPAPKLLDQTGSSVSQAPGRLRSSDGTTKQLLLFTMGQVGTILRTIRKGKVGHQAGKKASKQCLTQRMWMSFQRKQLTIALLQITIPGVLALRQTLNRHYYL